MALITLSNIEKSFKDGENHRNHVLRNVTAEIERGEFVAIRGTSGSGKTTLLSILGTLLVPDAGSYRLDGEELTANRSDHSVIRNRKIGFVFQDHRLMPQYTALENILLPVLATVSRAEKDHLDYARRLMELMRIEPIIDQYPDTLSGGEASRVAVCRALMMKPLLLLADEPTGQLDAANARKVVSLLTEVNTNLHTTIVMVTHSEETSASAHRTLTLEEGVLR